MSIVSALPFIAVLTSLALLPQLTPHLWEDARRRGAALGTLAVLGLLATAAQQPHAIAHAAQEYVAFMVLLATLYLVAGCIVVHSRLPATPACNAGLLAVGASIASLLGTTGASMLLIRPLLRCNRHRRHRAHTVVFFIFLVSNVGGLLLPLGDPPLFLGFLRGVPFFWTLRLWRFWGLSTGLLLLAYYAIDRWFYAREPDPEGELTAAEAAQAPHPPTQQPWVRIEGARNFAAFLAVPAVMVLGPRFALPFAAQQLLLLAIAAITYWTTPKLLHRANALQAGPMVEVAQVFFAIFASMPPALRLLLQHQDALPLHAATDYFWSCGLLSAFLDNAPCYLTFASLAAAQTGMSPDTLAPLAASPAGALLLEAAAAGAVTMGAVTYIGNGPNLMVRSMAETYGVAMPSFTSYLAWSLALLLPVLACARWLSYALV